MKSKRDNILNFLNIKHSNISENKTYRLNRFVVIIGTFLFGVLIQPTVGILTGQFLSIPENIILIGILCSILFALLVGYIMQEYYKTHSQQNLVISDGLEGILKKIGITWEYIAYEQFGKKKRKDPYDIMLKLVTDTEEEFLVLDHRPSLSFPRFSDSKVIRKESREEYYDKLNNMVLSKNKKKNIKYTRIVQIKEDPSSEWDETINNDQLFSNHCKIVINSIKDDASATIKTSKVFYPNASIIVVDKKFVLIEFAIIEGDNSKIKGDLYFNDPDGLLAKPISQFIENVAKTAITIQSVKSI
jgi:hypothetical protein